MLEAAAASGLELHLIDASEPLEAQGRFDAILHKLRPNEGALRYLFGRGLWLLCDVGGGAVAAMISQIAACHYKRHHEPHRSPPPPSPPFNTTFQHQHQQRKSSLGDGTAALLGAPSQHARDRPAGLHTDAAEPSHHALAAAGGRGADHPKREGAACAGQDSDEHTPGVLWTETLQC